MHLTVLAAPLAVNAGPAEADVPGLVTGVDLSSYQGVRGMVTVTAQAGRPASVTFKASPVSGPNAGVWYVLAPSLTVDALGNRAPPQLGGNADYHSIPPQCRRDCLVKVVANGNGGPANFTLTQAHIECL